MELSKQGKSPSISDLLLRHGTAVRRMRAKRARGAGLCETDGLALAHLLQAGELSSSDLGRTLALSPVQTFELLDRLEQDGFLLRRATVDSDLKTVVFAPTPLARLILQSPSPSMPEVVDTQDLDVVRRFVGEAVEASERTAWAVTAKSADAG